MQADLAASQSRNEELHRVNEELRGGGKGGAAAVSPQDFLHAFLIGDYERGGATKLGGVESLVYRGGGPRDASDSVSHPDDALWGFGCGVLQAVHEHPEWNCFGVVREPTRWPHHLVRRVQGTFLS